MEEENEIEDGYCHIDVDVLIIGGGLAGMTSALKLLQKEPSLTIRILEASSDLGGQMTRCPLGELAGNWIETEHNHIYNLVRNLNIPLHKRNLKKPLMERCWTLDNGLSASFAKFELSRYIKEVELKLYQYKKQKINDKNLTMEQHINSKLFFEKSRTFIKNVVLLACGAPANVVLHDDFMAVCAGFGGLSKLIGLYFLHPETLQNIDTRELIKALKEKLQSVDIRKSRRAIEIQPFNEYVQVLDSKNELHCASLVILAVPWPEIVRLQSCQSFPTSLRLSKTCLCSPEYVVTSLIARFSRNYWREAYCSGSVYIENPFIIGYELKENVYCCLYVHEQTNSHNMDSCILVELSKLFGNMMLYPSELHMKTYPMSYVSFSQELKPYERLIWSSSKVSGTCHRGCLNGAVESGLKAAFKALTILRPQCISWRDAAEIRCKSIPLKTDSSWLGRYSSSWNLYSLAFYGIILGVTIFTYKFATTFML